MCITLRVHHSKLNVSLSLRLLDMTFVCIEYPKKEKKKNLRRYREETSFMKVALLVMDS